MIRFFIGCAPNHDDAESQAVLEWSIAKHCSTDYQITWMKLSRDPASPFYSDPEKGKGWNTSRWATPFSGFRWAVPELAGFEGKAIYADSDVIFMRDPAELWKQEFFPLKAVMATGDPAWRLCVSLWNCAEARKHCPSMAELQREPGSHRMMTAHYRSRSDIKQAFRGDWNCLDGEPYEDVRDPRIGAIHYTSMSHQPQLKHALPRLQAAGLKHWFDGAPNEHWRPEIQALFDELLAEAEQNGFQASRYTQEPVFGHLSKLAVGGQSDKKPSWQLKPHNRVKAVA